MDRGIPAARRARELQGREGRHGADAGRRRAGHRHLGARPASPAPTAAGAPAVRQGPDRAARLRADAEPVRAGRGRLRGGVPGLPGHVPVRRRVRADAERAQRRRRHHRLAGRAALVRRQHRHVRRVLPGVRAVGQRLGLPAPEGDRAGRDHHRLLHDPLVLRGRRAVLARGSVVVHGDGARRKPARGRAGTAATRSCWGTWRGGGRNPQPHLEALPLARPAAGEGVALVGDLLGHPDRDRTGRTCP